MLEDGVRTPQQFARCSPRTASPARTRPRSEPTRVDAPTPQGHRPPAAAAAAAAACRSPATWPTARFLQADASEVEFPASSFDAVVCLYVLIHLPLGEQPPLLGRIGRWLRPGGWLLASTGHRAWTGTEDHWPGGDTPMWWSHADAATYRTWIEQAGLSIVTQDVVPEGDGAHALFWARQVTPRYDGSS